MAIEIIDLGTVAQDGADGDVAREAFEKVNANFAEHESEIDALTPRVTTLENEVGQLEIQAGQIQGDLTNLTESFNLLSSEVGSNTADIQNLENSREYTLTPGTGITIDRTDPTGPVISSTGSSGSVWGQITGNIEDQEDLFETISGFESNFDKILINSGPSSGAGVIPYNGGEEYPAGSTGAVLKEISNRPSFSTVIESIFELINTPQDEDRLYVVGSYHGSSSFQGSTINTPGGGVFRWSNSLPKSSHNGGTIISPTVPWNGQLNTFPSFLTGSGETDPSGQGVFVRELGKDISVCDFGAVSGNDSFDNRIPFQLCIDACSSLGKVFIVNPTPDDVIYHIKSFHPNQTNGKHCLIISKVRNFTAIGYRKRNANIKYSGIEDGTSLICLRSPTSDWGLKLVDLGLDAGNKLDYCLLGTNTFYAVCEFLGGSYAYAKLDGIRLSLYMSTLSNIHSAAHGRDAFSFCGPDDQGGPTFSTTTSLTVSSCWGRLCGRYGFHCENPIWYSNFESCGVDGGSVTGGVDRFQIAYKFYAAHGLVMDACGAEKVDMYAQVDTFVSLAINNPKGTDIGPTTGNPYLAMIFLGGGFDASIRDIPNGMFSSAKFQYAVSTNANTGNERIEISGGVIERTNCYFTPSTSYKNWPDVFYFPAWGGSKADRGKPVLGCQMYSGQVSVAPRPTERTYVNKKVVDLISSVANPQSIDLLEVSGPLTAQTLIKVELTIAKYAGSPAPAVGSASFLGSAMIASSTKSGGAMVKVSGEAYTATLTWVGDKLTVDIPAQYVVAFISVEFWSRSAFCRFL